MDVSVTPPITPRGAATLPLTASPNNPPISNTYAAEIALETLSPWILKCMLYSWYGTLLVAFVMMNFDWGVQWDCMNFCGGTCGLEVRGWSSDKCIAARTNQSISWFGNISVVTDTPLNRFMHLFISMRWDFNTTELKDYLLRPFLVTYNVALRGRGNGTLGDDRIFDSSVNVSRYIYCYPHESSCDINVLPADMPAGLIDEEFVLTMFPSPEAEFIARHPSFTASVGAAYQKAEYTIAGLVIRYLLLIVTVLNFGHYLRMLRLGVTRRTNLSVMTEQWWVVALQLGFILYVNPLNAWCVFNFSGGTRAALLQFLEFHISGYFPYLVLTWNMVVIQCVRVAPKALPRKLHVCILFGMVVMVVLDILLVVVSGTDWTNTEMSFELYATYETNPISVTIVLMTLVSLQYGYFLFVFLQALVLYFTLSRLPYYDTRARQLSFRLFAFVLWLYYVYRMGQTVYFANLSQNAAILSYQRNQQIPEIFIAFVFTQIVTYCYVPTHRDENTPPPPSSELWKTLPWGPKWYNWIALHGGSLYFFRSVAEETEFNRVQELELAPVDDYIRYSFFDFGTTLADALGRLLGFRPAVGNEHYKRSFFCYEIAVWCFNLSWEVYFTPPADVATPIQNTGGAFADVQRSGSNPILDDLEEDDDETSAIQMTELGPSSSSAIAPKEAPQHEMNTSRYGFDLVRAFMIEDVQAIVCVRDSPSVIAIAFRGTVNASNVKYDFKLTRSYLQEGSKNVLKDFFRVPSVHLGFRILWSKFEPEIVGLVDTLFERNPNARLLITGHSLGGALANMCALHFATRTDDERRQHLSTVYTFGSPRLGNSRFRDMYNAAVPSTFRVVNQMDIVTRMSLIPDNPHVGCEVSVDPWGNMVCSPTFMERMFRPWNTLLGVSQHLMSEYQKSLDAVGEKHRCFIRCRIPQLA
eukprot:PhF_6_TR26092/c0_g1_i2/m.36854